MSEYQKKQAKIMNVSHDFSGKNHHYTVNYEDPKTGKTKSHMVSIQVNCDCEYFSTTGVSRKDACSHILAVFKAIWDKGNIKLKDNHNAMRDK